MVGFLLAVAGVLIPVSSAIWGGQNTLVASLVTASSLIWPGYLMTVWIWPESSRLSIEKRFCLVPLLSLLLIVAVRVIFWFAFSSVTILFVETLTSGMVLVISLILGSYKKTNLKHVLPLYGVMLLLTLLMSFVSSGDIIQNQSPAQKPDNLTEFSIVSGFSPVKTDSEFIIQVSIHNMDKIDHSYSLLVLSDGSPITKFDQLLTRAGERSVFSINILMTNVNYSKPVDLYLFRETDLSGTPFRQLRLWLDTVE